MRSCARPAGSTREDGTEGLERTALHRDPVVFFAPTGGAFRVAIVTPPEILDITSPEDLQSIQQIMMGFSMVRPANHGLNLVIDYQGRTLGRFNHYATSHRRLSAAVPERGVATVYQRTGDALPWLCLALTVLVFALLLRSRAPSDSA